MDEFDLSFGDVSVVRAVDGDDACRVIVLFGEVADVFMLDSDDLQ